MNEKNIGPEYRSLKYDEINTFIRYNNSISIINKIVIGKIQSFSTLISSQTPFGLITSYKGNREKNNSTDLKMFISGHKAKYKSGIGFVPFEKVIKGKEMIEWHKVFIPKSYGGGETYPHSILGKPFYGAPQTVCNQSYLIIGPFENKKICENVISYITTKFFRFLVLQKKNSQDAMKSVYEFVPIQDFSKPWTDTELYAKYNLSQEEIDFIESMIKPMDLSANATTEAENA